MLCIHIFQYKHVNATKKDVIDVITNYRSLSYNLQKFGKYIYLK